jgi:WD40 repeat protein
MRKIFLFILFIISLPLFCFDIAGGHKGKVTALIHNGDTVISAGEDGFIVIWSVSQKAAMEKFQLTTNAVKTMVKHPEKDEICVIESGDTGSNRISAWNYKLKERLFSIQTGEAASFINYSAGGKYIITADFKGTYFIMLDSANGKTISQINIPSGGVTFGITGKTEQNVFLYQGENEDFEGQILYLDLASRSIIGRFKAPADISNPVIFGNNRFLAGINSNGLLLTDAASGLLLDSIKDIERGALLFPLNDGFYCLSRKNSILYRFSVDRAGKIVTNQKLTILPDKEESISAFAVNGTAFFASESGNLFISALAANQQNKLIQMAHNFQERITEIAANSASVAFLTEDGGLCFLPLDYKLIRDNNKFSLEKTGAFTRITAIAPFSNLRNAPDPYILWQSANTRLMPKILYSDYSTDDLNLKFMINRHPLQSISSRNNNILVLDSSGQLSIYNLKNTPVKASFTFSYVGAIDAGFVNDNYLLLSRSVINGSSPFLFVNYSTGETVPVPLPAQAGILTYTGNSGKIYAASVIKNTNNVKTVIYALTANKSVNEKLYEYPGEATNLTIAESAGKTAIAVGGDGAKVYTEKASNFDRTSGLPVKLLGCKDFFLSLDSEGNISWHNTNGKLLAVFRIYKDRWVMQRGAETIGGALQ